MKPNFKSIAATLLCFSTLGLYAQNFDTRLEPYFPKDELKRMYDHDKKQYDFLVKALDKGIFVADIPKEKDPVQFSGTLNIDPYAQHTFLSLGLKITDVYQYYRIAGTEKMLVVLPEIFLKTK